MPTEVARRSGRYPVQLSLNITEDDSDVLDALEDHTGDPRAVLARDAFERGLALLYSPYRRRSPTPCVPTAP